MREFTNGQFEFGADASAVAITAGAQGSAGTQGASAGASGGKNDATNAGKYYKGMVVFTIVKGGRHVPGCARRPEVHIYRPAEVIRAARVW